MIIRIDLEPARAINAQCNNNIIVVVVVVFVFDNIRIGIKNELAQRSFLRISRNCRIGILY